MFARNNYLFDGMDYDYDALNKILLDMLDGSTDENDVKKYSDLINDSQYIENNNILLWGHVVGKLTLDDAE